MTTVTRFAPSPTGFLHVGGARTALYAWLYAKKHQGEFVVRIEDTDLERSKAAYTQAILHSMDWLGMQPTQPVVKQTDRFDRYYAVIQKLLDEKKAYFCTCSKERLDAVREEQKKRGEKPRYDGHCRNLNLSDSEDAVVRFRNEAGTEITFQDAVKGMVSVASDELDDLIIRRSDRSPTYNLTVVVDDHDMGITHVIRGDDHVSNTPRQIQLLKALELPIPTYAHVPMILGSDGKRLSKRHGAMSVLEYRDAGILPDAFLNYLLKLGWSNGDQEFFTRDEMIQAFELTGINKAAAQFDPEKLAWLNQQHIKASSTEKLAALMTPFLQAADLTVETTKLHQIIDVQKDRVSSLCEFISSSLFCLQDTVTFNAAMVEKHLTEDGMRHLATLRNALTDISENDWQPERLKETIKSVVKSLGVKFPAVGLPLRVAVTGDTQSPSLELTLWLIGREKTLQRLQDANSQGDHA